VWNPAEAHLVGSSATLLDCANRLLEWGLLGARGCWQAAFHSPLALLGLAPSVVRAPALVRYDAGARSFILR
jgi:hypothetical protein